MYSQGLQRCLRIGSIVLAALMTGCATNPIPEGYTGPLATIKDTVHSHTASKADFFFVSQVNGKPIDDSLSATRGRSYGRGNYMEIAVLDRQVPARAMTLTLVGRTHNAMPISDLMGTVYQVKGDVEVTPEPDHTYVVKGELVENYSAVWLEDAATGALVGKRVEVHGSAALGLFEK